MSVSEESVELQWGIPEEYRQATALLFDEAFGTKFVVAVRDTETRVKLLAKVMRLEHGLGAFRKGELVGLAGIHTKEKSMTSSIALGRLIRELGLFAGIWAAFIFSLYEQKLSPLESHLDDLAVSSRFRSQGIGSQLLTEVEAYAMREGFSHVRLEVINDNSRARTLYESKGYVATKTESFKYLSWLLGFGGLTTMVKRVDS